MRRLLDLTFMFRVKLLSQQVTHPDSQRGVQNCHLESVQYFWDGDVHDRPVFSIDIHAKEVPKGTRRNKNSSETKIE